MEFRRAVDVMANETYTSDEPLAGLLASYDRAKFQRPKFPLWNMIRDDEKDRRGGRGGDRNRQQEAYYAQPRGQNRRGDRHRDQQQLKKKLQNTCVEKKLFF